MDISFKPGHLLLSELDYELRIRKVVTNRSQDDKRKILARLLDKERNKGSLDVVQDPDFNFDRESEVINSTLESIKSLIAEFEGPTSDSLYKRLKSRLFHITYRVQRMPIEGENAQSAIQLAFKNESYATCLQLDADLHEKVEIQNSLTNINPPEHRAPIQSTPVVVSCTANSIPVYKLGLQFDGESKKLLSFIERVEELAQARHISKTDLFESASDLFSGKATFWLRQVKSQLNDWDSLILKLKQDFLKPSFDEEIWEQIKARRQGKLEPVVIFVACMEALFRRLSRPAAEFSKIKYIRNNLQPEYKKRLALHDINSLSELSELCRKLEEADILDLGSHRSRDRSETSLIDSDLAYISDSRSHSESTSASKKYSAGKSEKKKSKAHTNDVQAIASTTEHNNAHLPSTSSSNFSSVVCWNCNQANHTYSKCKSKTKKRFCFKCGTPDVTIRTCKKCQGN